MAAFIFIFIFACIFYWYFSMPKNRPPGPMNLPFLGHYINWDQMHKKFFRLGKKYGPVCSFYRFNQLVVVINDYDVIKYAMIKQGDSFTGKLDNSYALRTLHIKEGLVYIDGDRWREQRRFALSTLRDLGIGRSTLEQSVTDEIHFMLPVFRSHAIKGEAWNPQGFVEQAVANVICRLIFGKRFDYEDFHFNRLIDVVVKLIAGTNLGGLIGFQNWFRYLPVIYGRWNRAVIRAECIYGILEKFMQQDNADKISDINDYVSAFIREKNHGKGEYFNEEQLLYSMRDLFAAGLDTTSSTLLWAILLCSLHSDVQSRCQQELDQLSGEPTLRNRPQTPYVEATLMEIQRYASVLPFLSRRTTKDVDLGRYKIPEGTSVFLNTWSVHMDEKYFPKPEKFTPERFIDEDGSLIKCDMLLPFGLGKRACMGEALARMELYLVFSFLLRHFTFRLPAGSPTPNLESVAAVTLRPYPYKVIVQRRPHDFK